MNNCEALQVGAEQELVYPAVIWPPEADGCFLALQLEDSELEFFADDNRTARVDADGLWLKDKKGCMWEMLPLTAQPIIIQ